MPEQVATDWRGRWEVFFNPDFNQMLQILADTFEWSFGLCFTYETFGSFS